MFSKNPQPSKINKLTLPIVRNVKIVTNKNMTVISWDRCKPTHGKLIGYNIYRFDPIAFIPKAPLNKKPLVNESYEEKAFPTEMCYIIRPVYKFGKQEVEGPGSAPKRQIQKPSNLEQAGGLGGRTIP